MAKKDKPASHSAETIVGKQTGKMGKCPNCNGRGFINKKQCIACQGFGRRRL